MPLRNLFLLIAAQETICVHPFVFSPRSRDSEPEVKERPHMRWPLLVLTSLIFVPASHGQFPASADTISITGDADVKVLPDRVTVILGVETRTKDLASATSQTDNAVHQVLAVAHRLNIDSSDVQTDFIHVSLFYNSNAPTVVDYYTATKVIQIVVKDVSKFEQLLKDSLEAGANHIYGVEFSTSELRKYRDEARALAAKAAIEKAHALAAAAGFTVAAKPVSVTSYSYDGGSSYGLCCGPYSPYYYGSPMGQMSQNVVQSVSGGSNTPSDGSVSLGKINVTASVTMTFRIQ